MTLFATIMKLPRQRTLTEESWYYRKCKRIARTAASLSSKYRSLVVTFTTSFTANHLLSMKSAKLPQGGMAVFASQRKIVSSADAGNVPPEEKVSPVYMRGC